MLETLLTLDREALLAAHGFIGREYARLVQIAGELIVVWGALFLIALWLYGVYKKDDGYKVHALEIFSTIIITFILYTIVNFGVPQWRIGAMELTGADALIPHPLDNSFPSGHALFMASLLVGIFQKLRRWDILLATFLIGLITVSARVIGGVHYPGDIIGGWIFGTIGGLIGIFLIEQTFFQKHIFPTVIQIVRYIKL